MISNMIAYLCYTIFIAISFTVIGFGLAYLLKVKRSIVSISDVLLSYVLGIYAVTVSYALLRSSFITINIISLIILVIAAYYSPKESNDHKFKIDLKYLLVPIIVFFGLSFITYLSNYDTSSQYIVTPLSSDHHFLANISYYMDLTGQENEFHVLNQISSDYNGTTPYHYTELWLNAVVSNLFGLNFDLSLLWIVSPLLYYMVFLSFLSLYQTIIGKLDLRAWLLSVGFVFFFGSFSLTFLFETLEIPFLQKITDNDIWEYHKNAPYLLFITVFIILWHRKLKLLAYLSLIFMSFVQFTSIPAVFGFLFLWGTYQAFVNKQKEEKLLLIWLTVLSTLYIIQSSFFGNQELSREGTSIRELLPEIFNIHTYASYRINIIIKEVLYLFVKYHIFLVVLVFTCFQLLKEFIKQQDIIVLIGVCMLGLFLYSLLFQIVNAEQLYALFTYSCIPVFFFYIIIIAFKKNIKQRWYLLISVMFFICMNVYYFVQNKISYQSEEWHTEEYLSAVKSFLNRKDVNIIGASFRKNYGTEYSSYVTIYTEGTYLSQLKNGACTISFSDLDIPVFDDPLSQKRSENGYKLGWFYRNTELDRIHGKSIPDYQKQLELLFEGHFDYAIFSKDYNIPENFKNNIDQVIEDRISGEKFVTFNAYSK